ncbi:MAG TPA: hypothetical protein DEG42_04885 [Acholeplasmataceae bacterium]|nr:MAG: hypothetical protein A2084_02240 [Tenericutes bacterium GWC2_39_45]OHE31898.1 MAG: hypothetical protein A2009_03495 [Tenericutes bacterium GWD2_38_27]HBG32961.1 hypothetical protein [Acholeplasmataceae bacterium]HBY65699.1 hypothetical protein [Acholeplasmataceae bacterium]HCB66284.1 hypothetical protein [Acholeplasmataceae bacterium]
MTKLLTIFSLLISLPIQLSVVRYNYSYYGEVLHSAPGMNFAAYFNEKTLGTTLSSPEDMVVYEDMIYIIDSKTNSIITVDTSFNLVAEYDTFDLTPAYLQELTDAGINDVTEITLNQPFGIDVKDTGIYIADTSNFRIVKLNHNFEVIDVFSDIEDVTFNELNFEPLKITVDISERMYVVAKNVYEGILELDTDGSFNRFTGVNPIRLNPFQIFSRSLMTEEQLAQLQLFLPTEYTNISIDEKSFIYATSKPSENNAENQIQLINPKGIDVIKRNGYHPPMGDIQYMEGMNNYVITGPSTLVDIATTNDGIYTVLDQKRSRLFTYDSEGDLLYINGDEGSQSDKFDEGVAIAYLGDDLLILDRKTRTVIVYQLTDFGMAVNEAISLHNQGEFEEASLVWEEVLLLNTNYEIAYNGIGKFYLREKNYAKAMEYFNAGHDLYYYSKAYKGYRNEVLKANFGYIVFGVVVIVGGLIALKIRSTYKKGGSVLYED